MGQTLKKCRPQDIAIKAYFLGPQAENASFLSHAIERLTGNYCRWRREAFPTDGKAISSQDQKLSEFAKNQEVVWTVAEKLAKEFQTEIPKFSPRYIGHMFSDLSLPGLLGHWLALLHNSNNVSKESSRVGLKIETEAISSLTKMFGWKKAVGHFTSGGSIANLEALVRMRNRIDQPYARGAQLLLTPAAHYSWKKAMSIAGFQNENICEISLDREGRLSIEDLKKKLSSLGKRKVPILGLVTLFGSTELGTVDDLEQVQKVLNEYSGQKIWHHVDAAYGGFFASAKKSSSEFLNRQIKVLAQVQSVTLDPHKLGYIPFGCGAFLCREKADYYYAQIDIPYIQFTSDKEAGAQTIEGSRPATGATAMWLTERTMGLGSSGMGLILNRHLVSKNFLQRKMQTEIKGIIFPPGLDLNILCWTVQSAKRKLSDSNSGVQFLFKDLPKGPGGYMVAKTSLKLEKHPWLLKYLKENSDMEIDVDHCEFIRMTLMNPFMMTKETQTRFDRDLTEKIRTSLKKFERNRGKRV